MRQGAHSPLSWPALVVASHASQSVPRKPFCVVVVVVVSAVLELVVVEDVVMVMVMVTPMLMLTLTLMRILVQISKPTPQAPL